MARGSFFAGIVKSGALAAALLAGAAVPSYAGDAPKLTLSGSATMTTDYIFRGITNTNQQPAVQPEFDLTYGILWAYIWGSNTAYGENIEIDYGAGISPKWKDITFTAGFLYYTYPGHDFDDISYFEVKGGASWTSGQWTLAINDYWSPDFFQVFGQSNAIDGTLSYAFKWKLWNFFTPTISGQLGFQSFDEVADDYTYWNAGLTLSFLEHWSADIRYWDTDYNEDQCLIEPGFDRHGCDARALGTIKATF
jgi:uncharacterized protein (TIGR02001 family)